jgi:hypothetical protein
LGIDVYREWLKIESSQRPPNHYMLLGLKQFEDDRNIIQTNYRQRSALVRRYASGKFSKESQDLLDELARAMLTLTDPSRKSEYDLKLGRKTKRPPLEKRPMGQILLDAKTISASQLKEAQELADQLGIDLGQALVQKQIVTWEQATRALAQQHNLPYLNPTEQTVVPELIEKVPADIAIRENLFPLLVDEQNLLVAVTHALNLETLELLRFRIGMPVRAVLCSPPAIRLLVQKHYTEKGKTPTITEEEAEPEEPRVPSVGGSSFAGWLWRNAKWLGGLLGVIGGVAGYFVYGVLGALVGAGLAILLLVILLFTSK